MMHKQLQNHAPSQILGMVLQFLDAVGAQLSGAQFAENLW